MHPLCLELEIEKVNTQDAHANTQVKIPHTMSGMSTNDTISTTAKVDLLTLANDVLHQTQDIVEYLRADCYPVPTFAVDCSDRPETIEYFKLQDALKRSLEDLKYLVEGPKVHFRALCCHGYELAAVQVALDFNFFGIVPENGSISLEELAQKSGVDLDRTSRIIRLLATEFLFREPTPGYVAHNPSSYVLHKDLDIRSTVHYT